MTPCVHLTPLTVPRPLSSVYVVEGWQSESNSDPEVEPSAIRSFPSPASTWWSIWLCVSTPMVKPAPDSESSTSRSKARPPWNSWRPCPVKMSSPSPAAASSQPTGEKSNPCGAACTTGTLSRPPLFRLSHSHEITLCARGVRGAGRGPAAGEGFGWRTGGLVDGLPRQIDRGECVRHSHRLRELLRHRIRHQIPLRHSPRFLSRYAAK